MRTHMLAVLVFACFAHATLAHSPAPLATVPKRTFQPREDVSPDINIPSADAVLYGAPPKIDDTSIPIGHIHTRYEDEPHPAPSIDVGSFHLELGGTGSKAHVAHYTLNGMRLLGGGISGSVDGKAARVVISWPSGP